MAGKGSRQRRRWSLASWRILLCTFPPLQQVDSLTAFTLAVSFPTSTMTRPQKQRLSDCSWLVFFVPVISVPSSSVGDSSRRGRCVWIQTSQLRWTQANTKTFVFRIIGRWTKCNQDNDLFLQGKVSYEALYHRLPRKIGLNLKLVS